MWQSRFLSLLALLSLSVAAAQVPYVPAELLDTRVRLQGDKVTTCVFKDLASTDLDRAAAELISNALLVNHDVLEIPSDFQIYSEEEFYYDVYLRLVNDCDLVAGISLATENLPDWLTLTAAYASLPFVVITTDSDYRSLGDIPAGSAIGIQMGSLADMNFLNWSLSLPGEQRLRRLPYSDDELLLQRLADGSLEAAVIWLPNLLDQPGWQQGDYRVIDSAPVAETTVDTGFLLLANQTWLQGQVDVAIAALESSGALAELAAEHGLAVPDND